MIDYPRQYIEHLRRMFDIMQDAEWPSTLPPRSDSIAWADDLLRTGGKVRPECHANVQEFCRLFGLDPPPSGVHPKSSSTKKSKAPKGRKSKNKKGAAPPSAKRK